MHVSRVTKDPIIWWDLLGLSGTVFMVPKTLAFMKMVLVLV